MKPMTTSVLHHVCGVLVMTAVLTASIAATAAATVIDYEYDALDRVTSATYDDGQRINYKYDPAGNIELVWTGYSAAVQDGLPDAKFLSVARPSPNPFNARVVLHFEIRATQRVKVQIYDLRGRMVRGLVDEEFAPGKIDVAWDGRTGSGASLASGMYVARVKTEHSTAMQRMMLVK